MSKANQIRQKAQEFLGKGHIDKAIQEYRRLITIESKNPNLYNELGDIYLRAADKVQAVQNFEKAATIYEKVALYNNAVAVCKKILRVDPEKIDTMFRLGELRAKQKLTGEAVTFFTQYVEAILENPQTLLPRSQKDVDIMLELMPSSEAILAKAVEIYEQLGIKLKTIEIYRKLIAFAGQEGDSKRQAHYAHRMEEIKAGLSAAELENLPTAETVAGGTPEGATPTAGEAPPSAESTPAADVRPDEPPEAPPADSVPAPPDVEPARAATETHADDGKPDESGIDAGVDEAVEEAEMVAAMSQGREAVG
ncbi:MAG: tetratricopeptide repeat protein, partial [Candidatus Krumholzibacteria bacterium]|nr:tetratricopeptide repeat protein [Candidatus Krumholzibacteria bacterium]